MEILLEVAPYVGSGAGGAILLTLLKRVKRALSGSSTDNRDVAPGEKRENPGLMNYQEYKAFKEARKSG